MFAGSLPHPSYIESFRRPDRVAMYRSSFQKGAAVDKGQISRHTSVVLFANIAASHSWDDRFDRTVSVWEEMLR